MGDLFVHTFVIWMPFIVAAPCVWTWAVLIRGELHYRDDEIVRQEQLSSSTAHRLEVLSF
jgi:hypothetical protein